MDKRVVAIIVTHNRLQKLKTCWTAIACQNVYGIVVVNNNSIDGTKEWLESIDDDRLRPLHIEKNIGGAGGFRKGCEYGMTVFPDADWFLLLDDDAYALPNLIEEFSRAPSESDLVSTKVLTSSGSQSKMNTPLMKVPRTIYDLVTYLVKRNKFAVKQNFSGSPVKVAVSSFVGLFVSRPCLIQMFKAIRSDFFIYCDDAYFTYQAYLAGYTNYYMPKLMFFHDSAVSKLYKAKLYYIVRNDVVLKKAYSPKYFYLFVLIRFIFYAVKKYRTDKTWTHLPLMIRALSDGVNNELEERTFEV